jgi:hypothetical protein
LFFRHVGVTDYRKLKKQNFRVDPNGINSTPDFIQIRPVVLEFNHADRQTDKKTASPICGHLMRIVQETHKKGENE